MKFALKVRVQKPLNPNISKGYHSLGELYKFWYLRPGLTKQKRRLYLDNTLINQMDTQEILYEDT